MTVLSTRVWQAMDTSPKSIDPSVSITIAFGLLITAIWSILYCANPAFLEHLEFKLSDAIVADAAGTDTSDQVVVVEIDDRALETWGQWPWPRRRLAMLLRRIADLGASCIALDFIMAEPDRTSPQANRPGGKPVSGNLHAGGNDPAFLPGDDTILAETLARGPFVLGYEFSFADGYHHQANAGLHPLEVIDIHHSASGGGSLTLYQARGVVGNIEQLARAAPYSGFLNGRPDRDGRLRRLPLIIRYGQSVYPSLALAALQATLTPGPVMLKQRPGDQTCLTIGPHTIPIDDNGNLSIRFTASQSNLRHLPANRVLAGQVAEGDLKGRLVLVGLSASGLGSAYLTPPDGRFSAVEVHAQALETILSKKYICRHMGSMLVEIVLSVLIAIVYSLCIARLEFLTNLAIGTATIAGIWTGVHLIFIRQQLLVSPLLPVAVVLTIGVFLMLFKYWTRQQKARRHMQDALILMKRSENNLNAIIKTIPDIVFRLDTAGRITFISPALTKYRQQAGTLIGRPILDLVAAEDRELAAFRINERRTGKRATADLEIRLLLTSDENQDDSDARYFSISAEGIYTTNPPKAQSFAGTQGIARDINPRKQLEKQLERSKKMEAIGSLAAGVAHDLNNILSGLVSYPELLLLDLPGDNPLREKIATIQRAGQRAADIVQDLLMIARHGVKNHRVIDLNAVINNHMKSPEFQRLKASHPGIRFTVGLADDLMRVKGSEVHISKLLMNLFGNAAEAMPTGGTIHVNTGNRYLDTAVDYYEHVPEGEYVVLSITDEGVGIPPTELHRIFEPFFSKKRMGTSGSGLGMTVIWNTIKDHAGYVDIHSREGEGTRFDIFLPATRDADNQTECRVVLQDYTGTERILVVDDVTEQRDIAVRMLGKLGYQVASASGGEEAVAFLRTNTVDLVVLDMVMSPGIDGLETYRRILENRPGQKAIIASGYAESSRVKTMQDLGAGEYIRKPYTLEKIGLAVRRELGRKTGSPLRPPLTQ